MHVIRLLLIDDHSLIRQGLKAVLAATDDICVIADVATVPEANAYLSDCDIVLIHLRLLPHYLKINSSSPIALIVMSDSDEEFLAAQLLQQGVLGYLSKQTEASELLLAVRKVAKGLRYVPEQIAQQLSFKRMSQPHKSLVDNPFHHLAAREKTCVLLMAQGKTSLEISIAMKVSLKTVNTYRSRLFQKLQVAGEVELIKLSLRHHFLAEPAHGS